MAISLIFRAQPIFPRPAWPVMLIALSFRWTKYMILISSFGLNRKLRTETKGAGLDFYFIFTFLAYRPCV